jgi:hypothetical protein
MITQETNQHVISLVHEKVLPKVKSVPLTISAQDMIAGTHNIDMKFLITLTGQLIVGKSYTKNQVNQCPWEQMFLLAMSKLNSVTQNYIVEDVKEIVNAVMNGNPISDLNSELITQIKAETTNQVNSIKGLTSKVDRGKVCWKGSIITEITQQD